MRKLYTICLMFGLFGTVAYAAKKNLRATFQTVTPFKSFDVIVTAEQDFRVTGPSGPEVLKATIQP